MEIHQSAVILLLVLSVSFSAHGQMNVKLLNQNVILSNLPAQSCGLNKHINGTANGCKKVHTFIQANIGAAMAVCGRGGISQGGGLYRSRKTFNTVVCTLKSGSKSPNCQYTGVKSKRYFVLRCARGWPVSYEKSI
ncbi:ribonuclease-like 3 [Pseudorasbora parva]|uniref:ribonuclease-like 3 n=1 Tax=Pseudorasbora parva TaxID=51549 RepID=UPI00351F067A